ncbi:hypothetical protein [Cyclobacterium sp. SYSU L10401]|nr:hypothetical protein [Cyclobacterium sp. SYSU L10401]
MKKLKFCIPLLLFVSCENFETSQDNILPQSQSYMDEIEELMSFYEHGFDLTFEILDKKMNESKSVDPYVKGEELFINIVNMMAKEMKVFENSEEHELHVGFERIIGIGNNSQGRTRGDLLNWDNSFSLQQKEILTPFINALEYTDNPIIAKNMAHSLQDQIINSPSLNYEEKISLLSISSGTIVFSDFVLNDGIEKLKERLIIDYDGEVRTLGCSVNTRNVLLAGVVGLGIGGTRGAVIGCTGGTVVFPVLGTAGGCVGGAVFGGALGYIEGIGAGIVSELLGSCFR